MPFLTVSAIVLLGFFVAFTISELVCRKLKGQGNPDEGDKKPDK